MYVDSLQELLSSPVGDTGHDLIDVGGGLHRLASQQGVVLPGKAIILADPLVPCPDTLSPETEWHHAPWYDTSWVIDFIRNRTNGSRTIHVAVFDLERFPQAEALLCGIRELLAGGPGTLLVSARNIARRDIAVRLMLGHFDLPATNDEAPPRYTQSTLTKVLARAGLRSIRAFDIQGTHPPVLEEAANPALATNTPLGGLLSDLRNRVDAHSDTDCFIHQCIPCPVTHERTDLSHRPFLSIVMRTQGQRPDGMRDALLALTAQSDSDFELLVIGHRVGQAERAILENLLAGTPAWMRDKTRYIQVNTGSRAAPLNVGFEAARGQYIAMLDDDDLVFGHWVETFHLLARTHAGQLLRAVCVAQLTEQIPASPGGFVARAAGTFERRYSERFDFLQHLSNNQTPCMAIAYPRHVFHDLGFRFDEYLHTTEDWDFMMRTALLCGVASSPEITAIYRVWSNRANSQTLHDREIWQTNEVFIKKRMDLSPALLEAGMLTKIRELVQDSEQLKELNRNLASRGSITGRELLSTGRRIKILGRFVPEPGVRLLKGTWRRLRGRTISPDDVALLESSPLFDAAWYLETYPDVAGSGMSPAIHFLKHGGTEGRHPSPLFNGSWYLEQNRDVARAGLNPLIHYLKHGLGEGRRIKPSVTSAE